MLKGFTLIELLVVLLIFSLLAGLVVPRLTKMYASWQMTLERDEVLAQLSSLNYLAFQQRINFTLTHYPPQSDTKSDNKSDDALNPPLELPAGWQISTEQPIIFRANGACRGGTVYLKYSEYTVTAQLEPPFCRAKLLN
jgi:general secretion pathway protein G